jgi:hypothetical protein
VTRLRVALALAVLAVILAASVLAERGAGGGGDGTRGLQVPASASVRPAFAGTFMPFTRQFTARALRATTNALRYTADQTVPGSTLADVAQAIDDAVRQQQDVRRYLDELANSSDPYGWLMTRALCTGMEQLAQWPEDEGGASEEEWYSFLVEQLIILAPNSPLATVRSKVDGFVTTAQLWQIAPRVAFVYYRECQRSR